MKLSLPSHLSPKWALSFVLVLAVVQVLQGTPVLLAGTAAAFIMLATFAFNAAGGLQYPSGAYIFFNAVLSAILGMVIKVAVGEPLNTNLIDAQRTLSIYVTGMGAMLVASLINQRLRRRRPLLRTTINSANVSQIALGCLLISFLGAFAPVSVRGTVSQFNRFGYLAILISVSYRVKETNGKRSFTWIAFFGWFYNTLFGTLAFSKEGMFGSSLVWAIAAVAAGYQVSWRRAAVLAGTVIPAVTFLPPISQVGRVYKVPGTDTVAVAEDLLSHPLRTRELYLQEQADLYVEGGGYHWFNHPQGLLDRLTMVPIDDALIYATDHSHPGSLDAVWSYFVNAIPRYLYPGKPTLHWGNVYAHEIGALAEDDDTTGISFTPYADAYHTGRWLGVTAVSCGMFLLLFVVCDSVAGSVADGPWALLYIGVFAHAADEGMLGALVYVATTYTLVVVAAQIIATYVAPSMGLFAVASKPALPHYPELFAETTSHNKRITYE